MPVPQDALPHDRMGDARVCTYKNEHVAFLEIRVAEWRRVEALLLAVGCRCVEGAGSSVTFERDGLRLHVHRPHPQKEALRYRVRDVRHFLTTIGVRP